jgi:predicted metal-binding membrane protein
VQAARALPTWAAMCLAMMVPAALPAVRHVAANSLRWRRQRAIVEFLLAYLAVWAAFGLLALAALALVRDRVPDRLLVAAALVAAAGWQLAPYQRRFLRDCHRTVPLPPRGWRATAGCARFGLRHGRACAGVCGPLMLVMAATTGGTVLWMVAVSAASGSLRLARPSARARARLAAALGVAAFLLLLH